jgi:hypothetical protein
VSLFRTIKIEGEWWGVWLVNPEDEKDRYLVTSPFSKEKEADHFRDEFNRIAQS